MTSKGRLQVDFNVLQGDYERMVERRNQAIDELGKAQSECNKAQARVRQLEADQDRAATEAMKLFVVVQRHVADVNALTSEVRDIVERLAHAKAILTILHRDHPNKVREAITEVDVNWTLEDLGIVETSPT